MGMIDRFLDFFFPPCCASCKKEGDFLCKKCVQELRIRSISGTSLHPSPSEFRFLDGVIYAVSYADNPAIRAAVAQFKYKFTRPLCDCFAALLSQKLRELAMLRGKKCVLLPVPLHQKRLNYRGFNQAGLIARGVAECFGEAAEVRELLKRVKHTSQQARLNKKERHENLAAAFEVTGDVSGALQDVCFLVDDVCTTGATLENCAQVLKQAGLRKVYGLVVARAFK